MKLSLRISAFVSMRDMGLQFPLLVMSSVSMTERQETGSASLTAAGQILPHAWEALANCERQSSPARKNLISEGVVTKVKSKARRSSVWALGNLRPMGNAFTLV